MNEIRRLPVQNLKGLDLPFQDKRLPEMLFRYRARNFPESLDSSESARWQKWCTEQLTSNPNGVGLTVTEYSECLDALAIEKPQEKELLTCLRRYGDALCQKLDIVI